MERDMSKNINGLFYGRQTPNKSEVLEMEKEKAVEDYFQNIIKKSWTWEKLTEEEQQKFINCDFDWIKGSCKQRQQIIDKLYSFFLIGLGYQPINWREKEEIPLF